MGRHGGRTRTGAAAATAAAAGGRRSSAGAEAKGSDRRGEGPGQLHAEDEGMEARVVGGTHVGGPTREEEGRRGPPRAVRRREEALGEGVQAKLHAHPRGRSRCPRPPLRWPLPGHRHQQARLRRASLRGALRSQGTPPPSLPPDARAPQISATVCVCVCRVCRAVFAWRGIDQPHVGVRVRRVSRLPWTRCRKSWTR